MAIFYLLHTFSVRKINFPDYLRVLRLDFHANSSSNDRKLIF